MADVELTDTDSFSVVESTLNDAFPPGDNEDSDLFTVTEQSTLVRSDGVWTLCPPYTIRFTNSATTVASCGSDGYEEPTYELHVARPQDSDGILPLWDFMVYDGQGNPINLSVYDDVHFSVAGPTVQWEVDATVVGGIVGRVQTTIFDSADTSVVTPGDYLARFTCYTGSTVMRSMPTYPIEVHIR